MSPPGRQRQVLTQGTGGYWNPSVIAVDPGGGYPGSRLPG
jgi:hypothetical protein